MFLPLACLGLLGLTQFAFGAETAADKARIPSSPPAEAKEGIGSFLQDLLPMAWQPKPKIRFNVFTEMTAEGRQRPAPTPDKPLTYFSVPGTYGETGWLPSTGEKVPRWEALAEAMQKALANNGYAPIANEQQRPDLLIVFTYGSHATDLATLAQNGSLEPIIPPPMHAEELLQYLYQDQSALRDVIQRARFIGGDKAAFALQQALFSQLGTPADNLAQLLHGSDSEAMRNVVELAFHTCYFVTATAYDFTGVEKKQKVPLWQTRMTVEAIGVDLSEVLRPLIINTGPYLGRETPEAVILDKRLDREGRVEVGEATVREDDKPATSSGASRPR